MKITIVLGAFFPVPPTMGGAVEKMWYSLGQEFALRGHEVAIVSRKMPKQPRKEITDGVWHLRVRGFDTPRSLVSLKFLDFVYSLRAMSILPVGDILVTNTFWLPLLARDRTRGKMYVHVGRYPKGQMRFYGHAARLQAPSTAVARAISAEAPRLADRVSVAPYPAPRSTSAPPEMALRPKRILYVGRVHPEKGVHLLVDAFVRGTRAAFTDWELMIVGPTDVKFGGGGSEYLSTLRRSAVEAGDRVIFAGSIFDPYELEQTFRSARLFVYPSLAERGESFGLAPLEAMTHGCAALVSNLDCFTDFVRDGETGFIFDHRSSSPEESLRIKIEKITNDEALLARVAEAGRHKSEEYSLSRVADRFIADFSSIVQADAANPNR
ncbi:MAG TPA: glycosyltransferase family 4 protein [Chthoniobacterales bacterium]|jgi:glycosyltransferase involved in cell wall biosynthesis|nr:glycosyltransferase family 4 protein [Chthoniobacterales bacterium]